ncbi:HIT family protein [Dethiothermospora halolimnae]|uniref:HIT family protein n=1 Tax=Dethiothermospora halolimnae TaxID=3114390 RepID=UPI003CCC3318
MSCIFCNTDKLNIKVENDLAYTIFDKYPVNEGHMLVIPKRHFQSYFDATKEELQSIKELIDKCRDLLDKKYNPDGYNIAVNINEAAGQTIMHLHIHIIPRYKGDVEDPRGGIRNLKPQLVPYKG